MDLSERKKRGKKKKYSKKSNEKRGVKKDFTLLERLKRERGSKKGPKMTCKVNMLEKWSKNGLCAQLRAVKKCDFRKKSNTTNHEKHEIGYNLTKLGFLKKHENGILVLRDRIFGKRGSNIIYVSHIILSIQKVHGKQVEIRLKKIDHK